MKKMKDHSESVMEPLRLLFLFVLPFQKDVLFELYPQMYTYEVIWVFVSRFVTTIQKNNMKVSVGMW